MIMDQPRFKFYKEHFALEDAEYRSCSLVLDELNIKIERPDNFGSNYDPVSDTFFANTGDSQVVTYMVKGIQIGWWFIIQVLFYDSTDQMQIRDEIDGIREFIMQELNLIPYVYIADMADKYEIIFIASA
jgi:hypothetical protein